MAKEKNHLNSSVDRFVGEVRDYFLQVVENNELEISMIKSSNSNDISIKKGTKSPKSN